MVNNTEIVQIALSVANEKGLDPKCVLEATQKGLEAAAKKQYGHEHNIEAQIDKKTGDIKLYRKLEVVENVDNIISQISLEDALTKNNDAKIGDFVYDQLPPVDIARQFARVAEQVIIQEITKAVKNKEYEEYSKRVGDVVLCYVSRIEYGDLIVNLGGKTEGIIKRTDLIGNENKTIQANQRIKAYIQAVKKDNKGPQISLSRTHPEFLAKLFTQEVPEIYDGLIEIKAVSREPGSRAKMAVFAKDSNLDPVGSCVGIRGSRVQAVMAELQGEKIDIIPWSSDPATFVVSALSPTEVAKVIINEESRRIEVIVPTAQLSIAIGRRGQNVRLASQLTGWKIEVMTEDEESKKRAEEFNNTSNLFIEALDVDDVLAHYLVVEGFNSIEDIANYPLEDMASIEGFDENLASELITRAQNYLNKKEEEINNKIKKLKLDKEIANVKHMTQNLMISIGENNIKKLSDLADLSRDEFKEIVPNSNLTDEAIDEMIMDARSKSYEK